MPNQKGGKKFKRHAKHKPDTKLKYKGEGEEYAQVKKVNGSGRYHLLCFDGQERLGIGNGRIKKRVRVQLGDIVLVERWLDMTADDKCTIIHKYDDDEARKLQSEGHFPDTLQLTEDNPYQDVSTDGFDYGDDGIQTDIPQSSSDDDEEEDDSIDVDDI